MLILQNNTKIYICTIALLFCVFNSYGQFTLDKYTFNIGGGKSEGTTFSTTVATGEPESTETMADSSSFSNVGGFISTQVELVLEINEAFTSSIKVYPNPTTSDNLQIHSDLIRQEGFSVLLFDSFGNKMINKEVHPNASGKTNLDISELKPGLYILKVPSDSKNKLLTYKVLIR